MAHKSDELAELLEAIARRLGGEALLGPSAPVRRFDGPDGALTCK
jgi:hypothetical protein